MYRHGQQPCSQYQLITSGQLKHQLTTRKANPYDDSIMAHFGEILKQMWKDPFLVKPTDSNVRDASLATSNMSGPSAASMWGCACGPHARREFTPDDFPEIILEGDSLSKQERQLQLLRGGCLMETVCCLYYSSFH